MGPRPWSREEAGKLGLHPWGSRAMGEGSPRELNHRGLLVGHGNGGAALELRRPREAARGSCRPAGGARMASR
jgi:hypothetical protein